MTKPVKRILDILEAHPGVKSQCGCCKRPVAKKERWCRNCKGHLLQEGRLTQERTYLAQFGKPCPFEGATE